MPIVSITDYSHPHYSGTEIEDAKRLFFAEKLEHFTTYTHCDECQEHDQTLLGGTIDTIGLKELGNPGWDPICFSHVAGIKYIMPAVIRLTLITMDDEFYLQQLLFHLENNGKDNDLYQACSKEQRVCIARFIEHMVVNHTRDLDRYCYQDNARRVHEMWAMDT